MTKDMLRRKARQLAKEVNRELLQHIDESLDVVDCEQADKTEWGHSYAIVNAFLLSKRYPSSMRGHRRIVLKIQKQTKK